MIRAIHNRANAVIFIALFLASPSINAPQEKSFEGFINGIRANAVKGEVIYQRELAKFPLEAGLKLTEGDLIRTGAGGYAELLLQPGNYLRLGDSSECQIFSDGHDKMRFNLNQGAVNLEILARDGEGSWSFYESLSQRYELIRVITPNTTVFITQPGVFRINAMPGGRTDLIVRKGEALINGRRVKEKRRAMVSENSVTVIDIDPKIEDSFDSWSRERADTLVQANRSLKNESPWSRGLKPGQEASVDLPDEESNSKSAYVVSAKPGAVNFVEAGVESIRPGKEWQPVTEESQLEAGDKLRTSADSFAELTMLPDINFRLDGGSEVSFEQLSNESISLKLLRGSAILDVVRFDSKQVPQIKIAGLAASFVIADKGNYRIDIKPNGDEITIRQGKVIFKERSVGGCTTIAGGTVSDCDRKRTDSFDFWSEHRGEGELFNGNANVAMVTHLAKFRRLRFRNTGFWFQNPGQVYYTFVPYTFQRFRSPYGGSYSTVLAPHRSPVIRLNTVGKPPVRFPEPPLPRP